MKKSKSKTTYKQDAHGRYYEIKNENPNSLGTIIKNTVYMVRLAFEAAPWRVICQFVDTLLKAAVGLFFSIVFLEKIVGYLETGAPFSETVRFVILSVPLFVLTDVFSNYYRAVIWETGNQAMYEKLHLKLFEKATDVELECFENPAFYESYTKASSQIKGNVLGVLNISSTFLASVGSLLYLTYKSVRTDPFVLLFAALPFLATYVVEVKKNKASYERYQEGIKYAQKEDYVRWTVYDSQFAKEIRLSNIFTVLKKQMYDAIDGSLRLIKKYGGRIVALNSTESAFNYTLTVGCTIAYAALRLLFWKSISAADFVVLVSVIINFSDEIVSISKTFSRFQEYSQYIDTVREFQEYQPKISESQDGIRPIRHTGAWELSHVNFTYFGQSKLVLKDVSIRIGQGQKIALVGHNGAGKTTLVKLLMRLYDPQEGTITLNGKDIREYNVRAYRDLFGTIFQDFQIFALSVAENVMMDEVQKEDRKRVLQALKNSGADKRVDALKNGIDTVLTREFDDEGAVLSGGEFQKIALARVFAKDSDIVILDEPSSALDPIAEYKMYESMLRACKDRSMVFISHRLSSAVLADYVYMLEDGQVIEEGSHRELMEKNGKYAQMFRLQAKNYQ